MKDLHMNEIQEKSVRRLISEHLADFIKSNNLTQPYGGDIVRTRDRKDRVIYSINFSLSAETDGSISVYSEKFLLLSYYTKETHLPPKGKIVFKKTADVIDFLDSAFVNKDTTKMDFALSRGVVS